MIEKSYSDYEHPRIALIAAMTKNRVIGSDSGLPWSLPEDLEIFKNLTVGNTVMMGRKTFESIGKPLAGRHNIVLSRSKVYIEGVQVCARFIDSLGAALALRKPVFVIGGAALYKKALPIATEMHISWVNKSYHGDAFFPDFSLDDWNALEETQYPGFTYVHYCRK